ncbi:MAG: F0F1 ATP synthase subunit delta [Rhodospirillaceae bacterium]|nr:F0F1 ATP synthase subunit delta [Rhodospirillaceae bacterium]MBT4220295.1 F0F1 ATP synthase subunit delta [Rhodospirillaceae bacterium]MBT4464688.1 F0F1 ATP synthase subunit delta [Rhodospirillaceae bacterium]MBT5014520.1 F0F1 ATP synthase subunit delta [Rhodospirillaceae bacterium]MBT5308049.1 F0F1 ATP synthase subunit delta [Rhodospirillaceae bacterium]
MPSDKTDASGLAGRYAIALFESAENDKQLDAISGDLDGLSSMIAESEDLRRLFASPAFSVEDKSKAVLAVAEAAGMQDLTRNFIGVVSENRRLADMDDIIESFRQMMARHRGEATVDVTSATELSDSQVKTLSEQLKKAVGSSVTVNTVVEPELLGGLIVKVGSRMVDSSLRSKLQQLRLAMIGNG